MTNNQFCSVLGIGGIIIACMSMGLMFFGITPALWGAVAGVVLAGLGLVNFD